MVRQTLNINSLVLKWLKKEFQLSDAEIAQKMGVKVERYILMEDNSIKPSLNQLRKLSRNLKVPLMVFYLKRLPDGRPFPTDYRNRADSPLGTRSVIAIRRGYLVQNLMSTFDDWQEVGLGTLKGQNHSKHLKIFAICVLIRPDVQ